MVVILNIWIYERDSVCYSRYMNMRECVCVCYSRYMNMCVCESYSRYMNMRERECVCYSRYINMRERESVILDKVVILLSYPHIKEKN